MKNNLWNLVYTNAWNLYAARNGGTRLTSISHNVNTQAFAYNVSVAFSGVANEDRILYIPVIPGGDKMLYIID